MNSANLWNEIFTNKEWGKYPSENLIRFIARNFYNAKNRNEIHILELGLGTGANLWFCAREGFRVSGIEWSKTGVERFKKRLDDENLSIQIDEILTGDYEVKLDEFKDESFDCIIDSCSLCCNDFNKTKRIFDKAISKLKIGSKFYSSTIAKGIVGYDKSKDDFQLPNGGIYTHVGMIRFSNKEDIAKLYKNNNFTQTSLKIQSIEDETGLIDRLFIVEGEKINPKATGGGDLQITRLGK
ncbi:class I SAM-dependent methyltransferase [Campylobacter sp. US33a]|uniref:class I SAM-dependent methyltransferase n=1 Tax=Campylobacter sp. US33a TaxID=2498120 RepID=UPI001067E61F|nr:class I SAM-dependent methyltransferase [Campylobacter sp. US33a]TEY02792.1 class I SAM-dependent methyltransferase [Campylobacter sp. US33a]